MKVLIVEDDRSTAEIVKDSLTANSHTVDIAVDGADGSFLGRSYAYDAIVLDHSLPKKNGLVVCREIRAAGKSTPIVFLTAADDMETKIAAFDQGADDYMVKPFSLQELHARLRALGKRPTQEKKSILRVDDLSLDINRHSITRGDELIHLTRKEFNLLEYLMQNAGTILSRALLLEHVWTADSDPFSNTVEAHIRNVRKKICPKNNPNLIANVPGRGYVINTPENLKRL